MKKNHLNKFFDYQFNFSRPRHFFHQNIAFLYPKPLYVCSLVLLVLLSFLHIGALKLFFPLLAVYLYLKLSARKIQGNLKVSRSIPAYSKEEKVENFKINISNPNGLEFNDVLIFDNNTAYRNRKGEISHCKYLPHLKAHEKISLNSYLPMNNGMGTKKVGPLVGIMTDPLGVNRITHINDFENEIKVFPKVHPTKSPKMLADLLNLTFGEFDTFKKGNNVNFYSTKEYQEGDNVNRINWKLSLKTNSLIVNEFENNTNATLYTVLINDDRLHFGDGNLSSFEYCKDLILSLFHANVRSNNNMGFISHNKFVKPNTGKRHINALEMLISDNELQVFEKHNMYSKKINPAKKEIEYFSKKIDFYTDEESNLFIFSGFIPGKVFEIYLERIFTLRRRVKRLHLILIYGYRELMKEAGQMDKAWLAKLEGEAQKDINQILQRCKNKGIDCSILEVKSHQIYKNTIKEGFRTERAP